MERDRPLRRDDVMCRDMGTERLLYDAEAEAIHVLNPSALLIWNLCDGNHSVPDMEKELLAAFSVAPGHDVVADIRQTVDTFAKNNLLVGR